MQYELESDSNTLPPFSFYPESCENKNWTDTEFDKFIDQFDNDCAGQQECNFTFNSDWLPSSKCEVYGAQDSNWQYIMTASCISEEV